MKEMNWNDGLSTTADWITNCLKKRDFFQDETPILVLISGGSCSGKTTFAQELLEALGPDLSLAISLDDYFKDYRNLTLPRDNNSRLIFDHPEAYHKEKLKDVLSMLMKNKKAYAPLYDMTSNTIVNDYGKILMPHRVIIVEGLFSSLYLSDFDFDKLTIYIEVDYHTALSRRLKRDKEKYGASLKQVSKKFDEQIWPNHNNHVFNQKYDAKFIIKSV